MYKTFFFLICGLFFFISCSQQEKYPGSYDTGNASIWKEVKRAQRSQGLFWKEQWSNERTARYQISLKTGKKKEFVWLEWDETLAGELTGKLISTPLDDSIYKQGDMITVDENDLTDWVWYEDNGATRVGGYTIDLLHSQEETVTKIV